LLSIWLTKGDCRSMTELKVDWDRCRLVNGRTIVPVDSCVTVFWTYPQEPTAERIARLLISWGYWRTAIFHAADCEPHQKAWVRSAEGFQLPLWLPELPDVSFPVGKVR
jgi:hypothetical protein